MTQDLSPDQFPPLDKPGRTAGSGRVVIAGMIGSCALGVGLGLWARPAPPAPPAAAIALVAEPPRPALQIVVDDTPAPMGQLLEVLPADLATPVKPHGPPRLMPVEPQAPRVAAGLVKVDAVIAAPSPVETPTIVLPPVAPPRVTPAVKVEPAPRIEPAPKPKVQKAKVEKIEKPKVEKPKVEKAKVEKVEPKPRPLPKAKVAVAKPAKVETLARVEKPARPKAAKLAKVEKPKAVRLAKAEPKKKPAAKTAEARPKRVAVLVKAAKATPKKIATKTRTVAAKKKPVQVAAAKPQASKARPVQAKAVLVRKPKVERPKVEGARAPARRPVVPRGEGPMRVARADACASPDPGEAVVCADRRLAARDRQLQQAYRNAEAAGVPTTALRRQQARWVQARAAAAREAPWAVEDVYEARISELNDLSRDATEN